MSRLHIMSGGLDYLQNITFSDNQVTFKIGI